MTVRVTIKTASRAGNDRAAGQRQRESERDRERDDAAHAGPRQHERLRHERGGRGSPRMNGGKNSVGKIHSARTTTRTRLTTMPIPTSRMACAGASERRSSGTSRPVMMKIARSAGS